MINEDKIIDCPHCNSQLCYENQQGEVKIWVCLTCGFTANSQMKEGSEYYEKQIEFLPELYKELIFIDEDKIVWLPNYVHIRGSGMIYVDGTSPENCKWVAVKETEIPEEDRHRYPIPSKKGEFYTHKPDMSTKMEFEMNQYVNAYFYIFTNPES